MRSLWCVQNEQLEMLLPCLFPSFRGSHPAGSASCSAAFWHLGYTELFFPRSWKNVIILVFHSLILVLKAFPGLVLFKGTGEAELKHLMCNSEGLINFNI